MRKEEIEQTFHIFDYMEHGDRMQARNWGEWMGTGRSGVTENYQAISHRFMLVLFLQPNTGLEISHIIEENCDHIFDGE
jgi:hypothetical protein